MHTLFCSPSCTICPIFNLFCFVQFFNFVMFCPTFQYCLILNFVRLFNLFNFCPIFQFCTTLNFVQLFNSVHFWPIWSRAIDWKFQSFSILIFQKGNLFTSGKVIKWDFLIKFQTLRSTISVSPFFIALSVSNVYWKLTLLLDQNCKEGQQ